MEIILKFPPKYIGWRGLHMIEGGRVIPYGMPAVIPPVDQIALTMTESIQRMSFSLMKHFYPALTGNQWRNMHSWDKAMTNEDRNGYDGGIPLRDYINGRDLTAGFSRYDKEQRTFQGTFIRGELKDGRIWCTPGIHGIDATQPLPSIEEIVRQNWYVIATNVGPQSNPVPSLWAQGYPNWIVFPFIFDRVISFPAEYFERWESAELPQPVKVYKA